MTLSLSFEKGIPTALNGKKMSPTNMIKELNELGGKHGIGIVDIVENRVVGMKSRGVYETPGGTILMEAHMQLEELILDRATLTAKKEVGNRFADIVIDRKCSLLYASISGFYRCYARRCDRRIN